MTSEPHQKIEIESIGAVVREQCGVWWVGLHRMARLVRSVGGMGVEKSFSPETSNPNFLGCLTYNF